MVVNFVIIAIRWRSRLSRFGENVRDVQSTRVTATIAITTYTYTVYIRIGAHRRPVGSEAFRYRSLGTQTNDPNRMRDDILDYSCCSCPQRQRRRRTSSPRPAAAVVGPGRCDAAQDRGDGRGAGGQVVADHAVPVREVLVQVQADRGGDAPRPVHGGGREDRPGHTGHVRRVRVPGHAGPVHIVGRRVRARLLRHRPGLVPAGGRHKGPDRRDQAHGRRADRRGRQQARPGQLGP